MKGMPMAPKEPRTGDALGLAMLGHLEKQEGWHVLERDDGQVEAMDAAIYFRKPSEWPEGEPQVLEEVRGRVLDIGAGAGRYALELQRSGHEVVALDVSAGAIEVCQRRGVDMVFIGSVDAYEDDEGFDTFLLAGNNLGLLASRKKASGFLAKLRSMARPGAQIVGTNRDPYSTDDPDHLAYHELNRSRDRSPGQLRLRVRYHRVASLWFDYWLQSPDELQELTEALGWSWRRLEPLVSGNYLAVLDLTT